MSKPQSLYDYYNRHMQLERQQDEIQKQQIAAEIKAEEQQLAARVRYHEVKVRALAVPEVRAALEASQTARSDRALREALRQHYTLLFRQIRALDSSLEPLVAQREKEAFLPLIEKLPRSAAASSR